MKIRLNDGIATCDAAGCTVVLPPHVLTPHITLHPSYDLEDLVRWALDHGYGGDDLSLRVIWDRQDLEMELGCKVDDNFIRDAQNWLESTWGGLAATTACHLLEDVINELKREFAHRIAFAEPLCIADALGSEA